MITLRLEERSVLFLQDGAAVGAPLPLGPALLAQRWLRHEPPHPEELEAAIEVVEDTVMPLHRRLAHDGELQVSGAPATRLAQLAGVSASLAEVEVLFNRAAALAEGRPSSSDPLLAVAETVAVVLLLREVMHHLGFTRLVLAQP